MIWAACGKAEHSQQRKRVVCLQALLLAGVDAAQILCRAPVVLACLAQPQLFLFRHVDYPRPCFANQAEHTARFDRFQLFFDFAPPHLKIFDDVHGVPAVVDSRNFIVFHAPLEQ